MPSPIERRATGGACSRRISPRTATSPPATSWSPSHDEVGVEREEFVTAAIERSAEMTQCVIDEHNSALEHGVTAVPTVVFGGGFPVPGAQDVETYERLVERIIEHRSVPPA